MSTLYQDYENGSNLRSFLSFGNGIQVSKLQPGDTVRIAKGMYKKCRRKVDGKRRTIWACIGEPTDKEKKLLLKYAESRFTKKRI